MILGVDIGGTNTRVAAVDSRGRIRAAESVRTGRDIQPRTLADRVAELARKVGSIRSFECVGVGFPSPLSADRRMVRRAVNLPKFRNVRFGDLLRKRLRRAVVLENDANAAAFGEYAAGAGKGGRSVVVYTLGTGVGGGIVLDGKLVTGETGFAGELGHTKVDLAGPLCGCGKRGCLEAYAGAASMVRQARKMGLEAEGGEDLFRLARRNNRQAKKIISGMTRALGASVASVAASVNPSKVVLGGGMSREGGTLLRAVVKEAKERAFPGLFPDTRVVLAKLGSDAGIIGAALWAREIMRKKR